MDENTNGWSENKKYIFGEFENIKESLKEIKEDVKSLKENWNNNLLTHIANCPVKPQVNDIEKRQRLNEKMIWIGTGIILVLIFFREQIIKIL